MGVLVIEGVIIGVPGTVSTIHDPSMLYVECGLEAFFRFRLVRASSTFNLSARFAALKDA